MRKRLLLGIAAPAVLFLGLAAGSSPATVVSAAPAEKVSLCHAEGNGSYHPVTVAEAAVPSHLNHGDADFSGYWAFNLAFLTVAGDDVSGVWNPSYGRPPFFGTLIDGCNVLMTFPDDAIYQGTLLSPCFIQWSYPNQPGTTDPDNYWICTSGPF